MVECLKSSTACLCNNTIYAVPISHVNGKLHFLCSECTFKNSTAHWVVAFSPRRYVEKAAEVGLGCLFFMLGCFLTNIFRGIRKSQIRFPKIKIDDFVMPFRRHVIYDQNVTSIWINNQVTLLWAMFFILFSQSLRIMTISGLTLCQ